MGEFSRQSRKGALGERCANHRIIAGRENRSDLDEKAAFTGRDRPDSAAPPQRIDIAFADRAFELRAPAEGRARHHADATLGFQAMAMAGKPVAVGADAARRCARAFHPVQRAWRRLGDEAGEIERAARLWAGAREPRAAERLHADRRANDVAVDIDVADFDALDDSRDRLVDARVQAEGEAVA